MPVLSIPPLVMSALAFYIGIYHFLTYLTNKQLRVNLTFSLMCFAIGLYNVCCVGNYNSSTSLQGYEWQRMQLATIALVALGLLWFIRDYTSIKNRIAVWSFTIFFGGCSLVEFFDRSNLTWIVSGPLEKTFVFFGHNITYHEVSQGIFTDIEAFGLLCFFTYLFWLSFYFFWRKDSKKGFPLLLAVTVFYLTMFEDVMVSAGFYDFIYTLEYGYVGFLLIMAYAQIHHNLDMQKKLRESEDQYRILVEGTESFVTRVNSEGELTFVNQASERIYGLKPGECIGLSAFDFVHPDDRERTREAFSGWICDKAQGITIENRQVSRTGEVRDMAWTCTLVLDDSGEIAWIDGIAQDITLRKQAEQEREMLLKTLSVKNKELQSILYIASHDLQNPLVNIQGFSKLLNESCTETASIVKAVDGSDEVMKRVMSLTEEEIPASLRFISASADKMKVLLDGLLHVSRLGTADIDIRPLNMNDIVHNILKSMEFQIHEAEVEIAVDDLPGCVGDASQMDQLFSNLIANALKYLDPRRKGNLHITGKVEGSQSVYCVEDNGIGIVKEHQPKIFELFHRLNPNDLVGGEGLGLTIVTRIVERHDGSIRVESEPGRGSKFFVSLPHD